MSPLRKAALIAVGVVVICVGLVVGGFPFFRSSGAAVGAIKDEFAFKEVSVAFKFDYLPPDSWWEVDVLINDPNSMGRTEQDLAEEIAEVFNRGRETPTRVKVVFYDRDERDIGRPGTFGWRNVRAFEITP